MEIAARLEGLSGWGAYREFYLPSSKEPLKQKILQNPPSLCWDLWKNPETKTFMLNAGYAMAKVNGKWVCVRTVKFAAPKTRQRLLQESLAVDSTLNLIKPPGLEYLGFQKGGIEFAINRLYGLNGYTERPGILIADDMGLGKTIQAIGVMNQNPHLREMQILIVCPASLKYNWRNEIRKWVVDGLGSEAFVVKKKWPDMLANIVIVNYDTMKKWQEQVRERTWDLIVFDEAHLLKNEKAQRTVYSIGGVHAITKQGENGEDEKEHIIVTRPNSRKFLFLTGTPMENGRAIEYWNFIKVCDPDGMGRSFAGYRKRYIETDDNYEELQETLRMKMMIRRMKTQVWTDMPEKIRAVVTLDPEEYGVAAIFQKEMSIFREYQEALKTWGLKAEIAKMEDSALYVQIVKNRALNLGMTLGEIAKMRKRGAIAKVPGVLDRIEQLTENKTPIIVFGHHMEVLDLIQEGAEKLGLRVVRVDGSCSPEARQAAMEAFQNGEADMFLGGIIPAGVGLTLTRATIVLFAELDWIPGRMTQAEDRAHRIGQKNAVLAEQVVMEASLDEYMAKLIIGKQEKIERACDSHRLENVEDMIGLDEDEKEVAKEEAEIDGQGATSKEKQFSELFSTEKASTKGYSLKRLEADAAKVTSEMTDLAKRIAAIAAVSKLGGMDKEICEHVRRAETVTGRHVAMVRRIAMKNKEAFMAQGITRSTIEETFER